MRVIGAEDEAEYGVALGSCLVSLLEPKAGDAVAFNRWYERDHFYAGCMVGSQFFSGRRFVATRPLKAQRYPASSAIVQDTSIGSYLALYWMLRGHHAETERWAVDEVLSLTRAGRMNASRSAVLASFFEYRWAACRDDDGVPPEVALEHPFAGVALVVSTRPEGVSAQARDAWLREAWLEKQLPQSPVALALSFSQLALPEDSPVYSAPPADLERRSLEIYFLDRDPREFWQEFFVPLGEEMAAAGMGSVGFASGFIPTLPGTDRYADEV